MNKILVENRPPLSLSAREKLRLLVEKRVQAFERGYRQNLALIGTQGVGKTHFLRGLYQGIVSESGMIPVYVRPAEISLNRLVDRWVGAVLTGFFLSKAIKPPSTSASLLLAADPSIPKTTEKIRHLKKMLRREKGAGFLKELFSLPEILAEETGKKVILLLDEFHLLDFFPVQDPFALLGKEITVGKNVLYLAASSAPDRARQIFRERLTLLFGSFEVLEIPPFEFDETAQYLERRFTGHSFSEIQKQFLIQMTDGNPAYLDLVLDQLEGLLHSRTYTERQLLNPALAIPDDFLIESFLRELAFENGRISQVFQRRVDQIAKLGKDSTVPVEAMIAVSQGRRKPHLIAAFMERKTVEAAKILQKLTQEEYLKRFGSFFTIEDLLFRFWLAEVLDRRYQNCSPDETALSDEVAGILKKEFERSLGDDHLNFPEKITELLKEFRSENLEIEGRKFLCPQFSEISLRETSSPMVILQAVHSRGKWLCGAAPQWMHEGDVTLFLDEIKRQRKKLQQKILITLGGIEQNAKLMAQEAGIQIWSLRIVNTLLDFYNLPKIVFFSRMENQPHEQALGALAQSLYSA